MLLVVSIGVTGAKVQDVVRKVGKVFVAEETANGLALALALVVNIRYSLEIAALSQAAIFGPVRFVAMAFLGTTGVHKRAKAALVNRDF